MTLWGPSSGRVEALVSVLSGLAFGAVVIVQPKLAPLGLFGAVALYLGVRYPPLLVLGMWAGMLFDRLGVTGLKLGSFPVTASKLSVLGSIGAWFLHATLSGTRPVRWHPVLTAMLGVLASTAVCIAWANNMERGKFDLYGLGMMTVLVALVYAVLAEAKLEPLYRTIAAAFSVALLSALRHGSGDRSAGTMGDPNEWATMVLLLTPMLLGGLAEDDHWSARPLRLALIGLGPLAVLHSESRAALVVSFLVGPVCLYVLRYRVGELVACGAAGLVAAPLMLDLDKLFGRFWQLLQNLQGGATIQDSSFEERSELFRQGKQLFLDHWFIGAGPGNFSIATGFVSHTGELRPAHNTYLEIASEQGLVGIVPTGIFLLTVASTLRDGAEGARSTTGQGRVLGVGAGLGALALMAATLGLLTFSMAYLVLGFALAIVHQARTRE